MGERGGLEATDLVTVVSSLAGAVPERDVPPGQLPDLRVKAGMALLDDGQVVGATAVQIGAVAVLDVQGVGGQHGAVQFEGVQQGLEGGDFDALGGRSAAGPGPRRGAPWRPAAGSPQPYRVREPRTTLPSTATTRRAGRFSFDRPGGDGQAPGISAGTTPRSLLHHSAGHHRRKKRNGRHDNRFRDPLRVAGTAAES